MLIRLFFLGLLLLQSSCVGIALVVGTRQVDRSSLAGPASLGPTIGEVTHHQRGGTTTADALRLWGKPKRRQVQGIRERWLYWSDDLAWRGVEIWLIIPIPLLLPVGFKKINLEFENNLLINYTIATAQERGFGWFISNRDSRVWRFNEELQDFDSNDCVGGWGCY